MNRVGSIVVVSHKYLTQPDDDIVLYLRSKRYKNVMHVRHSFSHASDRKSYFSWYKEGGLHKEGISYDFRKWPEPIIYFKELVYTVYWIASARLKWDMYIGMDGLLTFFGLILRFLRVVSKSIYWVIDFVPDNRFPSHLLNEIYKRINTLSYKNADEVWDLSPRMKEARKRFWGLSETSYRKWKLVPYGVWVSRVRRYSYDECEKNTLVFMGHLLEKQGVQLVIRAIPEIINNIPDLKFKIIGDGEYRRKLEELAKDLGVEKYCVFLGKIEKDEDMEAEIARSTVAIAPYIRELDTWTYYADPGKIKEYLVCGVPVLLTDLPWNSQDIVRKGCGLIINEDINDIKTKLIVLMKGEINREYRQNAVRFVHDFDYNEVFKKLDLN